MRALLLAVIMLSSLAATVAFAMSEKEAASDRLAGRSAFVLLR